VALEPSPSEPVAPSCVSGCDTARLGVTLELVGVGLHNGVHQVGVHLGPPVRIYTLRPGRTLRFIAASQQFFAVGA
jgi:hypothetical protein